MSKINNEKKVVLKNTFFLTIMQATNYLLPLISLPYLSRVLGPDKFGLVFFAQAFISYFLVLTDYGFNQIGVRQIANNADNKKKLETMLSSILNLKIILFCIGFILLLSIVLSFDSLQENAFLFIATYGMVLGNVLMPSWFFNGMQDMKYVTWLSFISKFIFTGLIFVVVLNPDDYLYVPILNTLGFFVASIVALVLIRKKYQIKLRIVPFRLIKLQAKAGAYLLLTNLGISSYTSTNSFVLGNISSNTIMGYYGGVEKLIQALQFMFNPVYTSLLPYFSILQNKNKTKFKSETKIVAILSLIIGLIIFVFVFYFAEHIIALVLGRDYLQSLNIFYVFSVLIFITPISFFIFNVIFIVLKFEKQMMRIYLLGGLINLILLVSLLSYFNQPHIAVATANVTTQILILLAGLVYWITTSKNDND